MDKTLQFGLPLLMPAQAQKHVTVNEALAKIDALAQLRLVSSGSTVPPADAEDGRSYFIVGESEGAWSGKAGKVATSANGGWTFAEPHIGWSAWDEETSTRRVFDGTNWVEGATTVSRSGASSCFRIAEFSHLITPGRRNVTVQRIPKDVIVLGITGRVQAGISGDGLSSWQIGVDTAEDRYGSRLGLEKNSYVLGLTSSPISYYEETPLLISADGGEFLSGRLTLCIHYVCLAIPHLS